MAAMHPEKSRSLHNFSLPSRLSWGAQRVLRCSKANSTTERDDHHYHRRPRPVHYHPYDGSTSSSRCRRDPADGDRKRGSVHGSPENHLKAAAGTGLGFGVSAGGHENERIEVVREKLMIDLQTEVDKIKTAILAEGGDGEKSSLPLPASQSGSAPPQPWNLRTRRAACREPNASGTGVGGGKTINNDNGRPSFSPPQAAEITFPRVRIDLDRWNATAVGEKKERTKFSVSLSRQEIEEDFMELTRRRPARKPKKRLRYVQKQLDTLFPGLWLSEITADMYKVNENPEPGKGQ